MKARFVPIFLREVKSLFWSPIAYLVLGIFTFISSYFFASIVSAYSNYSMQMMYRGQMSGSIKLMEHLFSPFWGNLVVTFIFLLPLISMRAFAEEKKSGTIEMLFTYPLSDLDIVLGKYLSMAAFSGIMVLVVLAYPFTLLGLGVSVHWPTVLVAALGLLLVCMSFLALGMFASALSENQVISAALGFGGLLMLFVVDWVARSGDGFLNKFLAEASVLGHFEPFSRGVLSLKDFSYFVLFIAFCLFGTLRVLESKKWR